MKENTSNKTFEVGSRLYVKYGLGAAEVDIVAKDGNRYVVEPRGGLGTDIWTEDELAARLPIMVPAPTPKASWFRRLFS